MSTAVLRARSGAARGFREEEGLPPPPRSRATARPRKAGPGRAKPAPRSKPRPAKPAPRPGPRPAKPAGAPPKRRLAPAERRRELVRVASRLLSERGVDGVQFAEVAAAAGVTRPLVYRFFKDRPALIMAVLEDFANELTERFGREALRIVPGSNAEVAQVFVEAVCDTIETLGAGPWHLLDSKGPDPEIARFGQERMDRLMAPWRRRLAETIGTGGRETQTLARMIVAAGRAVLDLWCAGVLTRAEAVRDTTRGVRGLIEGFAGAGRVTRGSRPRRARKP